MKIIRAVYSKWLRTGTTLPSSQPLSMMVLSSWLSSQILMCHVLREREHPQPNSTIPKYPFTSAKIAEYFVRENGNGMIRTLAMPSSSDNLQMKTIIGILVGQ